MKPAGLFTLLTVLSLVGTGAGLGMAIGGADAKNILFACFIGQYLHALALRLELAHLKESRC